jgi:hypothetical protein
MINIENSIGEIEIEEISPCIKKYTAKTIAFELDKKFKCQPLEVSITDSNYPYLLKSFKIIKYIDCPSVQYKFLKNNVYIKFGNILTQKKFMHFIPIKKNIRQYLKYNENLIEFNKKFILNIKDGSKFVNFEL